MSIRSKDKNKVVTKYVLGGSTTSSVSKTSTKLLQVPVTVEFQYGEKVYHQPAVESRDPEESNCEFPVRPLGEVLAPQSSAKPNSNQAHGEVFFNGTPQQPFDIHADLSTHEERANCSRRDSSRVPSIITENVTDISRF
uniref:Uncharacterized protein n=1 Tax=Branchiostoma floridae TaxID=7739 RepID=C3YYV1_BRAFL|eukprot:XP_002598447.1 hypothetical protein BRAFLDRAFT_83263 [Branchiostoma floridae]